VAAAKPASTRKYVRKSRTGRAKPLAGAGDCNLNAGRAAGDGGAMASALGLFIQFAVDPVVVWTAVKRAEAHAEGLLDSSKTESVIASRIVSIDVRAITRGMKIALGFNNDRATAGWLFTSL
jgi:hypothetical protein